ncbi:hypothetical protein U1Q18_049473 [Sarracenia purpurea var. burkii]
MKMEQEEDFHRAGGTSVPRITSISSNVVPGTGGATPSGTGIDLNAMNTPTLNSIESDDNQDNLMDTSDHLSSYTPVDLKANDEEHDDIRSISSITSAVLDEFDDNAPMLSVQQMLDNNAFLMTGESKAQLTPNFKANLMKMKTYGLNWNSLNFSFDVRRKSDESIKAWTNRRTSEDNQAKLKKGNKSTDKLPASSSQPNRTTKPPKPTKDNSSPSLAPAKGKPESANDSTSGSSTQPPAQTSTGIPLKRHRQSTPPHSLNHDLYSELENLKQKFDEQSSTIAKQENLIDTLLAQTARTPSTDVEMTPSTNENTVNTLLSELEKRDKLLKDKESQIQALIQTNEKEHSERVNLQMQVSNMQKQIAELQKSGATPHSSQLNPTLGISQEAIISGVTSKLTETLLPGLIETALARSVRQNQ